MVHKSANQRPEVLWQQRLQRYSSIQYIVYGNLNLSLYSILTLYRVQMNERYLVGVADQNVYTVSVSISIPYI